MVSRAKPARQRSTETPLVVVGIGASAGGLEAFSQVLSHLPATTGMAFVLVQHLDPSHESHLVPLLGRISSMPVLEASDGALAAPDHVYVIPPNATLSILQGALRITPRADAGGQHLPIDHFFRSLAEDRGARAIGVILSGTGADGTYGVQAIKAQGGITMAQDATAAFDGMPRSAIGCGSVDFVLDPPAIAEELRRIAQHPLARVDVGQSSVSGVNSASDALEALFRLLRRTTQVDYAGYKRPTIIRRIGRRMVLHRLERLEDYVALATQDPSEVKALHQDLLIHVTRFFRDPEVFEALGRRFLPKLVQRKRPSAPIRVWVPGCSTGEEAYSLAIYLLEALRENSLSLPLKLFATDLVAPVLDAARNGFYPESVSADISIERLKRFFVKEGTGFRVQKVLRDVCVFAQHDMTKDPPFSNLDLISCRNALIYLDSTLQKRALPLFHYALNDGGTLVLGSSETVGSATDLFAVADAKHRIYTRKPSSNRLSLSFATTALTMPGANTEPSSHASVQTSAPEIHREFERAVLAHYAPAGVLIDADGEILQFRGNTGHFLTPAPGAPSLNLFRMARHGLLVDMRTAIDEAARSGQTVHRQGLLVRTDSRDVDVDVSVIPTEIRGRRCLAVMFEDMSEKLTKTRAERKSQASEKTPIHPASDDSGDSGDTRTLAQVETELARTQSHLGSLIEHLEVSNEELQAANEESLSANEELQSTLEELQSTLEELQASNEELVTVNEELQRRNQEATQLSDDLSNLLRSVQIPIVMVAPDLNIRRYSPSAAEIFGGKLIDNCSILSLPFNLVGIDLATIISGVIESLEVYEADARDRLGFWHHLCVRPYRTAQNQIEGVVLSVVNIHDLKSSEQQLDIACAYAESILATVQVPLMVLNFSLRVVSANRAFFDLFGATSIDTEDHAVRDVVGRALDDAQLMRHLRCAVEHGEPFSDLVIECDLAALGHRKLVLNGRPLQQQPNTPVLVLVAIEDVTERERHETELRQSQKMEAIGQLASGIAHDVNNLMTIVIGSSIALLEKPTSDPSVTETLLDIVKTGERASALTKQLTAFSRKQVLAPKELDPNALVTEVQRMLTRLIGDHIQLTTTLEPEIGRVFADSTVLTQVVVNLAINARDAMPQGGNIVLETHNVDFDQPHATAQSPMPSGSYVCLSVRDSGSGIDPKTIKRIFEPFFTTKKAGAGTGLGLASVLGSVQQSGGYIDVKSTVGQGSTFSVFLPRVASSTPRHSSIPPIGSIPPGLETILLVEDNAEVRNLAREMLQRAGYNVLAAENGKAALELSETYAGTIHLLLSDVVMPQLGGVELARLLGQNRAGIRVLFVSGYAPDDETINATTDCEFLQKPFSPTVLAHRVRALLDA